MNTNTIVRLSALAALSLAASANATIWAFGPATATDLTDHSVGFQFNVVSPGLVLQSLGALDRDGDGFVADVQVRLYNITDLSTPLVSANVIAGTLIGGYRWENISPFALSNGSTYVLGVYYSDPGEAHGGVADGAPIFNSIPGINFVAYRDNNFTPGDLAPSTTVAGPLAGPNMNVVPEPETYALLAGLGLVGFGLYRRRQVRG